MKKTLGCVILLYNSLLRLALVRFLSVHNFETLAFFESLAILKTVKFGTKSHKRTRT